MKPGKKLLIAALVLLLCVGGYIAVSTIGKDTGEEPEQTEQTEQTLGNFEGTITRIVYTYGGKTYTLVLSESDWVNADDENMPLNADPIDAAASALKKVKVTRELGSDGNDLAAYGLDTPQLSVTAFDGVNEITYKVGVKNETLGGYYAMLQGSDTVYIIAASMPESLMKDIYGFVKADDFPTILSANVRGIRLESDGALLDIEYFKDGRDEVYTKNYTWFHSEPNEAYRPLRTSAVTVLAGKAVGTEYDGCIDYSADDDELARYGLDDPYASVKLTYIVINEDDTSEEIKELTLLIGADTGDGENRYFTWSDTDMVFTVSSSAVLELTKYLTEDMEPNEVCAMTVDEVTFIEMSYGGKSVTVKHTIRTSTGTDGTTTKSDVYTVGGDVIEGSKVTGVFTVLNALKAEDTAQPGYANTQPYLSVTLKSEREGFAELTLKAYSYNANFYRVSFNGRDNMLVSLRDIESLASAIEKLT